MVLVCFWVACNLREFLPVQKIPKQKGWVADLHSLYCFQLSVVLYSQQHRWLAGAEVFVSLPDAAREVLLELQEKLVEVGALEFRIGVQTLVSHHVRRSNKLALQRRPGRGFASC